MLVEGKKIAEAIKEEIKKEVSGLGRKLKLIAITVGEDAATRSFLKMKSKIGESVGVEMLFKRLPAGSEAEEVRRVVRESAREGDGVIVQLPLPKNINTKEVLAEIPKEKDVDVLLDGTGALLPPVVGAIAEILRYYKISIQGKKAAVVGAGRLVGAPAKIWLEKMGAEVLVVRRNTEKPEEILREADLIVSGAGSPGLIKPEMIKPGVILLDAGTSESEGKLVGDADPKCAEKASLFTPVPGGIGPIAMAILFKNLVQLSKL